MSPMSSNAAEAKHLVDQALATLIEALEQGRSDALEAYLAFAGRFHKYSLRNQILIYSQNSEATRVAGFRAWKKLGRYVLKGERGLMITVPIPIGSRKLRAVTASENAEETEMRFRAGYVFDVSQTEGEELPELPTIQGDPAGFLERLHQLAADKGIVVTQRDFDPIFEGGCDGLSKGGTIDLRGGLTPAEEFSVLAHELAHELLHKLPKELRPNRTVRELEAEAVAHAVSSGIGLNDNGSSSDYIALYDGDAETFRQSLERIRSMASTILQAILPEAA